MNSEDPLVSIWSVTYNHKDYIKECLDGIISQKTNFKFELIIGDDCSTDGTVEILLEYAEKYPEIVKPIINKQNVGAIRNSFEIVYPKLKGKYIAICEGDDYWTDPLKLQKQVDFLEANPDFSICFHKVKEDTNRDVPFTTNNPLVESTYTINDLAKENFIATVSVMFKKNFEKLPDWINYSPIGDYPIHMINAKYGKIKYLPEEMAAYRVGSGFWSTMSNINQIVNTMFCLKFLLVEFKDNKEVLENLKIQYTNFSTALLKPFEEKRLLQNNIKDYTFLEKNLSLKYIIKIIKIKLSKKFKL